MLISNFNFEDERGIFNKAYSLSSNPALRVEEVFYSVSYKDTVRGMHYFKEPLGYNRIIHLVAGEVIDVLLNIKDGTYTEYNLKMDSPNRTIFASREFAHGFKVLSDRAIVLYLVDRVYDAYHDTGFRYDSFGYDWKIDNPIISERDLNFQNFIKKDYI